MKAIHKRLYNGCTVCRPDAEGKQAEKLCGKNDEHVTFDWDSVTCKKCLSRKPRD